MAESIQDLFRQIPSVDRVLQDESLDKWQGAEIATEAVRYVLTELRKQIREGQTSLPPVEEIAKKALSEMQRQYPQQLKKVLNGTGIVIHTNLGRSPLGKDAIEAMNTAAQGYSTLEYDLEKGRRGSRHDLVRHLLCRLTGAEDALVANNNAAALLLALTTLSKRKEVLVSRGELVEIGGSFRIPDVCKAGGAKLHEVGTTNRTRITDYRNAISLKTGVLLRVHTSNYRISGFTESVALEELVHLGDEFGLPVVDDLGSGAFIDPSSCTPLGSEPEVSTSVQAGMSVVTFSGDKLLGGPQAGIAVGRAKYIEKMRKNPLMRAVRPDKLTFAALDATLRAYFIPNRIEESVPIWRMLKTPVSKMETWGKEVIERIEDTAKSGKLAVTISPSDSYSGGGSLPTEKLESRAICFSGTQRKLKQLQISLRFGNPPVIGYIKEGCLYLDIRTLMIDSQDVLTSSLLAAIEQAGSNQ